MTTPTRKRAYHRKGKVNVAPLVRRLMREHGLDMSGVAREIGVTPMTVWYWLHGTWRATPVYARLVEGAATRLGVGAARPSRPDAA